MAIGTVPIVLGALCAVIFALGAMALINIARKGSTEQRTVTV